MSTGNLSKTQKNPANTKPQTKMVNLEIGRNQILIKGPNFDRAFFCKSATDVSPKNHLLGIQINPKKFIILLALGGMFSFTSIATVMMWFTSFFQDTINSFMVITKDSPAYQIWKSPPPRPYFKFYLFNYTNVNEYENEQAKKLKVQEIGPYVYHEQLERVNVRFNRDGTVTYQEKRTYIFSEELSQGKLDDTVMMPNIPLLSGAAVVKDHNVLVRIAYNNFLKIMNEKPFLEVNAQSYIEGYHNNFIELSKQYLKFQDQKFFEKMGLLAWKQGIQPDVITMNTGVKNIEDLGRIEKFNGKEENDMWSSYKCDRLKVSDGMMYPRTQLKNRQELRFYVPQICRTMPLTFEREMTILGGVPALRYTMPLNVYDSPENFPENRCYCGTNFRKEEVCAPKGVFDASKCIAGAPVFFSFPYFYNADPIIQNSVTGLKPAPTPQFYLDIHPMGLALGGKIQVQINIQVRKSYGVYNLDKYQDGLMLPIFWVEAGLNDEDLGEDIVDQIYKLTFLVPNLELALKYGSLLSSIVSLACIVLVLKKKNKNRMRFRDLEDESKVPLDMDSDLGIENKI